MLGTLGYVLFPELRTYPGMDHLSPVIPLDPGSEELRNAMQASLLQAPQVLQHLIFMAQSRGQEIRRPSRPRELGLDSLFMELAGLYYAWFGLKPATGSDRGEADKPSLRWVGWVLKTLDEAVGGSDESSDPVSNLAATARGLTAVSKANRLSSGWRLWRQLPTEQQWAPDVWFYDGRPAGVLVPEGYSERPPS